MNLIIIGAGIGGLTAAIALARAGIAVEVYERSPELADVGAGISLWRNALVAFDAIDKTRVGDAVRAFSAPYAGAGLRTPAGDLLVAPALAELTARFGEVGLVLARASLQKILVDALGRDRIHTGRACVGVEQDATGVTATFADGSRVRGDGLVGADGLRSIVRATIHGDEPPRYSGYTSWRSIVTFDHAALTVGETWGRGARFGQVPMAGGRVYWYATQTTPAGGHAATGEQAELRRLFAGWHRPIGALIDATPERDLIRTDIYDRPPLRTWGRGRVTLLGDAAHPMTPNLGQGGCQAIEDAAVLARALRSTPDVARAFAAYEQARRARTGFIVTASRRVGALGQLRHPAAIWVRNTLMRAVGPGPQVRQLARLLEFEA